MVAGSSNEADSREEEYQSYSKRHNRRKFTYRYVTYGVAAGQESVRSPDNTQDTSYSEQGAKSSFHISFFKWWTTVTGKQSSVRKLQIIVNELYFWSLKWPDFIKLVNLKLSQIYP